MQVVLVYLQPFCHNSVLKCALHQKIAKKFTKKAFLEGSRSFKVIVVDKSQKPATSACYDEQHICTVPICNRFQANNSKITSF